MDPVQAGGLDITGPVGVRGFPHPSLTKGGVGTTISPGQDTVAVVGEIGGIGA